MVGIYWNCGIDDNILVLIYINGPWMINTYRIKYKVIAKNLDLHNWAYQSGVLKTVK